MWNGSEHSFRFISNPPICQIVDFHNLLVWHTTKHLYNPCRICYVITNKFGKCTYSGKEGKRKRKERERDREWLRGGVCVCMSEVHDEFSGQVTETFKPLIHCLNLNEIIFTTEKSCFGAFPKRPNHFSVIAWKSNWKRPWKCHPLRVLQNAYFVGPSYFSSCKCSHCDGWAFHVSFG